MFSRFEDMSTITITTSAPSSQTGRLIQREGRDFCWCGDGYSQVDCESRAPRYNNAVFLSIENTCDDGCTGGKFEYYYQGELYHIRVISGPTKGRGSFSDGRNNNDGYAKWEGYVYPDYGTETDGYTQGCRDSDTGNCWLSCSGSWSISRESSCGGRLVLSYKDTIGINESQTVEVQSSSCYQSHSITTTSSGASVSGNTLSFTSRGTKTFKVTLRSSLNYTGTGTFTVVCIGKTQTLIYKGPTECILGVSYIIQVSSNGLSSFTYSLSDPSAGVISGNSVTFSKPGLYTITVNQGGDSTWEPSTVIGTVIVQKKPQVLTFNGPSDFIVGLPALVSVSSNVGLSNFSIVSLDGSVVVNGMLVTATKYGAFLLTVIEAGNEEYAETSLTVSIFVGIDNFNPVLVVT